MKNSNYDVDILVNGKPQKIHYHDHNYYIEARENYEYSIKIKNNSYNRILAVVSVDGLSVMDGKSASDESGGYIIDGYQSYEIKGFRKDLDTVGAFKFVKKNNSYAKTKGNGAEVNCGVIGVMIFEEKAKVTWVLNNHNIPNDEVIYKEPYSPKPQWGDLPITSSSVNNILFNRCASNHIESNQLKCCNFTSHSQLSEDNFKLGSTWGTKQESKVKEVEFERGNLVFSVDIYYSTRNDLIDMGVNIIKEPKISRPQSFPKKFAEPPKGWS